MKANESPEKLYLISDEDGVMLSYDPSTKLQYGHRYDFVDKEVFPIEEGCDIEYVRKDVFIEAVANWMSDTLQTISEVETPSAHHVESIPALGSITQTEFVEKFKKEIEYLLD